MERSALVYIVLTIVTVLLGLCVDNREYVPARIRGGKECIPWGYIPWGYIPRRYVSGKYGFLDDVSGKPVSEGYAMRSDCMAGGRTGGFGCDRRQARNRVAVFGVYCLLTGVSACRIAVGNDYWVYRDNFNLIAQSRHVSSEFGFNIIVKWIQLLFGYDKYLPVFAFFSIVTVFFFVKALWDQGSCFAFSLYLLLTGGYYFNSLNSVRYYLALAIALYSMKYVLRGEYGKFIAWILAGMVFHKSVLLVIPVYLAARFLAAAPLKRWHYIAGAVFVGTLIFGQNLYREIIFYFYPYYRDSAFDNGELSYANIGKCVCVLALCLICYRRSLRKDLMNRFYFFLNVFGLIVYCCGSFIPEVSRVGYYMIVSQVFLLPRILMQMPGGKSAAEEENLRARGDGETGSDEKTEENRGTGCSGETEENGKAVRASRRVRKDGRGAIRLRRICYVGVIGAFGAYFVLLLRGMYAVDVRLLPYLNWIFN